MKNIIIINIFVLLGFGCVNALSATKSVFPITFVVHWDNPSQLQNPPAHLYDHPDCTVQLLEGDDVVFEVPFFPYTANNINLPAALSGQYELRIVEVGYYFSAVIELE